MKSVFRFSSFSGFLFFVVWAGIGIPLGVLGSERSNIILIMADDMGPETVGCYGGTSYRTPNLDRLAAQGMRFNQAYATPLCTNTRIQLMTGYYNNRNWLAFGLLDPSARTFGHYLQDLGYQTCIVGKWQLQSYDPPDFPGGESRRGRGMRPEDSGFDEYSLWHTGHTETKGSRYANPVIERNGNVLPNTDGAYGPDIWTDNLIEFIERRGERPFFAYYSMALPHWPFVPTPHSEAWADPDRRLEEDLRYASDMIEYVDVVIGRIVDAVDRAGIGEQTLIVFYSDNGTDWRVSSRMGDRVVRGGKSLPTDAGVRVPMIARWPGTIAAGRVLDDLVDSTDFLPTLVEAAEGRVPESARLDGRSFLPQLRGQRGTPRPWVYVHQDPRPGWDKDRFHLIRFALDQRFKLYEDGRLFDVPSDLLEDKPIMVSQDRPASAAARLRLQVVLDGMKPYPRFDPDSMRRPTPAAGLYSGHAFQDQVGFVVAEAEATVIPNQEAWRIESAVPGFHGMGYLRSLRDQPARVDTGAIGFTAKLNSSGRWMLALRHRKDHPNPHRDNGFWIRVNDGPWLAGRSHPEAPVGEWTWKTVVLHPDRGEMPLAEWTQHFAVKSDAKPYGRNRPTIWLAPRAANFKVDRVVLYQEDRRAVALGAEAPPSEFHPW